MYKALMLFIITLYIDMRALLLHHGKTFYAVIYSKHDMNASLYYYFLPISYERD